MRTSLGILASATVIFATGAMGVLGPWSLSVATIVGLVGAVWFAIVMEDRDQANVAVTAWADRRRPLVVDPAMDGALDAGGH